MIDYESDYAKKADIIMANLHQLKVGDNLVFDFYQNKDVVIKIKSTGKASDIASKLYKKSKNQVKEREVLLNKIERTEELIKQKNYDISTITLIDNYSDLKKFISSQQTEEVKIKSTVENISGVYTIEHLGYKILVGKNSKNNDIVTFKLSDKNDIWLHAQGVSGSHVVIKNQSKIYKEIPKEVIEYAGEIAAYNSKARGSATVPVVYTLRKFVRKPRAASPGAVVITMEKTIFVEPKNHFKG
jgi:predicted ribosome quality control (RQC) complex YloA/Tae2 family protein